MSDNVSLIDDKVGGQAHPRRRRQGVRYGERSSAPRADRRYEAHAVQGPQPRPARPLLQLQPLRLRPARMIPLRLLLCVESALPRCTGVRGRGPTRPPLSFKGCLPFLDREYPPLAPAGPSWQRSIGSPAGRRQPLVGEAEHLIRRYLPPMRRWPL